jgi:hypothetical protein
MKKNFITFILLSTILLTSCSTFVDLTEAQTSYYRGDYESTLNFLVLNYPQIEKKQGTIVYHLDEGIVAHAGENFKTSNVSLLKAERAIEENFTKSISANVGSFFLNESVRDYESAFYEDIYSNIFLSLNYYHLNNIEDAMVEVRRSLDKLQLREQNLPKLKAELENQLADNNAKKINNKLSAFESSFDSSALSYYLSSLFSFEFGDFDTFRISRDKGQATSKLLAKYYLEDEYTAFDTLKNVTEDSTLVNFIAFSGLAPVKESKVDKNILVIDQYVDDDGLYHKPYYTNVVYSVPKKRGSVVKSIEVKIGTKKYNLEAFENLELIAFESLEQKCSGEYIRAYIRALSREIGKAATDTASVEEGATFVQSSMISDIFSIFSFVVEGSGDLRCSHFFPSKSWIGSFEIEPGKYDIVVSYLNSSKKIVFQEKFDDYNIKKGKANLVEILSAK